MDRISSSTNNNENIDNTNLPPPPYTAFIYKLNENSLDNNPPPSYTDVDTQSVIYINNYPGPPLTDGYINVNEHQISTNQECILSKNVLIYLKITGIITILLGIIAFDLQIVIIATKSILHYYYGLWGGGILISIGISILILYKHRYNIDYQKLFHSFFCQMIMIAIIFTIGIIILITDQCEDSGTENNDQTQTCEKSNKIVNGFLFSMFALGLIQSIINTILFTILKRKYSTN